MSQAIKRLQKDLREYMTNKDEFPLIAALPMEGNIMEWHVNICGPSGPYANLPLHFILRFPDDYPQKPPSVQLCTSIQHPNVFDDWICLDMLKYYTTNTPYEGWSPCYTATSIMLQLQSFLFSDDVPQDYGGSQKLVLDNASVIRGRNTIMRFQCKACGHTCKNPVPALPEAFQKKLEAQTSKQGSRLLAEDGAVVHENTVFWQEFPAWKTGGYQCGDLLNSLGGDRFQFEVKIDWGWDSYFHEDIQIGWGIIESEKPFKIRKTCMNAADVGIEFWPRSEMKVGDFLTTAIDLKRRKVWFARNGKIVSPSDLSNSCSFTEEDLPDESKNEKLVPLIQFRACRLMLNFGPPKCPVGRFMEGGFRILEAPERAGKQAQFVSWASDSVSADVFPPHVFQVIMDFCPLATVFAARRSCPTVRALIEEMALIPRREVHCFVSKKSWKETVLGMGLKCEFRDDGRIESVQPCMEFLSKHEWDKGFRMSSWGQQFSHFIALPISRTHTDIPLIVSMLSKFGPTNELGLLNSLATLMNTIVVTMMKDSIEKNPRSEKLLIGYSQFHHTLLALNERYPKIAELATEKVNNFIFSKKYRHKSETPDLGKLLVMASLVEDLDWNRFMKAMFAECCVRRVRWYLRDVPQLANTEAENKQYMQAVFEQTQTSRRIVSFQVGFLQQIALPKPGERRADVLHSYFARLGQPRSEAMNNLFRLSKEIVACKTWKEHLRHVGLNISSSTLAAYLKNAVGQSLAAKYHVPRGRGRGLLKAADPSLRACHGLDNSLASADESDFKVHFYLPSTHFAAVQMAISKFHGTTVKFPQKRKKTALFPGPIVVGAPNKEVLAQVRGALKRSLPFLSVRPLQLRYLDAAELPAALRRLIEKEALRCCVSVKIPQKHAFPVLRCIGGVEGLQEFHASLERVAGTTISEKKEQSAPMLCAKCDLIFKQSSGGLLNGDFVCRFCWSQTVCATESAAQSWGTPAASKTAEIIDEAEREKKRKELEAEEKKFEESVIQSKKGRFLLKRRARVRKTRDLTSEVVADLIAWTCVNVVDCRENRLHITEPVFGWLTLRTAEGLLIRPVASEEKHFPPLGLPEPMVQPEAFEKLAAKPPTKPALKKTKPAEAKVAPKKTKPEQKTPSVSSKSSDGGSVKEWKPKPKKKMPKKDPNSHKVKRVDAEGFEYFVHKKAKASKEVMPKRKYILMRDAAVRQTKSKSSQFLGTLKKGSWVFVEFVNDENRARISSPYQGWISTYTSQGRMLKPKRREQPYKRTKKQ